MAAKPPEPDGPAPGLRSCPSVGRQVRGGA
nr:MAG TPA: hypothetical protein [Caudoviricetes sp.]